MSVVSGVVLCTSCVEQDFDDDSGSTRWDQVNAWLKERGFGPLIRVEDHAGGTKDMQMYIGCAGFNWFSRYEDDFAAFVMSLDWDYPRSVVLMIQPEEGPTRVWRPAGAEP